MLDSPPDAVFRALTDPDVLARWWGPRGFTVPAVELDLRVGGRYRIAMQPPDGELFYLSGEFREIDPPVRLVYTFEWEDPDPEDRETVVTLSLMAVGDSTELVLEQDEFATERRRRLHDEGWSDTLDRLAHAMSESCE
jgi:uncharacterized protein YndB with AHSA1/START domain